MKKVVVVGGGFGGAFVAKALENDTEVTLVDTKEFFEISWATLRALVEPAVAEQVFFLHSKYLTKAKVVIGEAAAVSDTEVTLKDGTTLPFDFLVIASGSIPQPTVSLAEKISFMKSETEKLKAAKNVLIVGGGPTGVELAGEIVTDFPDKKVTLVHGGSRLLEFVGEKASAKALPWLQSKGVTVILNDKVEATKDQWGSSGTFKTASGKEIATDYLAVATGSRANASWLEGKFGSKIEKSQVKVDLNLRVEGTTNIFAVGDITTIPAKQGYLAMAEAAVVAANIKAIIKAEPTGKPPKALKKFQAPTSEFAFISLGRAAGIACLPFGTFTGWFPTSIKSKGLFISKVHKDLKVAA